MSIAGFSKTTPNRTSTLCLWTRSIASLFIKRECLVCRAQLRAFETDICTACLADLPESYTWIQSNSPADISMWGRSRIEKVNSLFLYGGNYRRLVHSIKYKGNIRLAMRLGWMLGGKIDCQNIDFIIPVPLHPKKKRQRGYNQSELISRGLLQSFKSSNPLIAINKNILRRKNFTLTQTQKDRVSRWENVRNAFTVDSKEATSVSLRFSGKRPPHFLLVDDVLTTGATLDACASLLQEALPCKVSIATLAYVP